MNRATPAFPRRLVPALAALLLSLSAFPQAKPVAGPDKPAKKDPPAKAKADNKPAPWWNAGWSFRRPLTVTDQVRGAKPAEAAVAEVPTLGQARPDGADFRVVDRDGRDVATEVLACGFEDRALVAFAAPAPGAYWLYFGNPTPVPPAKAPPLKVSLVLEARELGDGEPKDWAAMRQLLDKSPRVLGRWRCPTMSLGFNPLGPWDHGIFVFSGWLQCPADGSYAFAVNAFDGSFLLVDDQPVAAWPGWHGAKGGQAGDHLGKVDLKQGVHRISFVNAFRDHGACAVGWRKPGDDRVSPIPADAYAGCFIARPGPAETRDGPTPDFEWTFDDDLGIEGRKVTSIGFRALSKGSSYRWDFGDGVTSAERFPQHVFLEAATFTVTCAVDGRSVTQKVRVQPARGHLGRDYERRVAAYADRIRDYPTAGLSAPAAFEMGLICHEARRTDAAVRGFRAALEKGYAPRSPDEERWFFRLVDLYRDDGKPDDAVWVCDRLLQGAPSGALAARALAVKAAVLYDDLDRREDAAACCKIVLDSYRKAGTDFVRMAYILSGELALAGGDRAGARKILEDAERGAGWRRRSGDFEITEGAHAINYEEALNRKDTEAALQEVASWVWEKPTVLLQGLTRHLRGRVFLARKSGERAVREFDRALAADPQAPFADEALFWKGQALEALHRKDGARACYEALVRSFPESQLVGPAQERLK